MDGSLAQPAHATAVAREHAARSERLSVGLLSLYGSGGMVDALTSFFLSSLLYFYLTAVCGLSGKAAGGAAAIALVADSAIDPIVGSLSDKTRGRLGRRHPYMLAAAAPLMVALGLLFSLPARLTGASLFACALGLLLAIRLSISLFSVPHIALGAELSDDYRKRSTIVAFRLGLAVCGTLTAVVLAYGVFLSGPGGLLHRSAYAPLAWTCGALAATAALVSALGTLGARERLHRPPPPSGGGLRTLPAELDEVRRNRSFLVLFGSCLLFFISQGMVNAMALHANTYFWGLPTARIQQISMVGVLGVFIGLPMVSVLSRRMEKRGVAALGMAMICAAQIAPVLLRLGGVIPATVTAGQATLMAAAVVVGAGVTATTVGFQSMMADAADEHEHLFAARREGLYFAGISFSAKASNGVGVLLAGTAMDLIRFPNHLAGHIGAVSIPTDTIRNLGLIYGPGAASVTFVAAMVLLLYRLDQQGHAAILATLAERRQAQAAADLLSP